MAKYGNFPRETDMTKKFTFTLEEELVERLSLASLALGKKKTQIVREPLNEYFAVQARKHAALQWQKDNMAAIESYNDRIDEQGVFSDALRSF
jgi:post-segregation antitoxin (ccd killing protein)